jgi:plasmid stabilization system protein ParE
VATVKVTARAFAHLEQVFEFIAQNDPARALKTIQRIREAVLILEHHPLIGRSVEEGRRELIVSRGHSAHVVLYRWLPADETVLILAIRDAKQAGYLAE